MLTLKEKESEPVLSCFFNVVLRKPSSLLDPEMVPGGLDRSGTARRRLGTPQLLRPGTVWSPVKHTTVSRTRDCEHFHAFSEEEHPPEPAGHCADPLVAASTAGQGGS